MLKDYIFHCKSNNKIKRIPNSYWQQVAKGQMPIPGFENQRVHIAIVRVSQSGSGECVIQDKQFDSYVLDNNGFIKSPALYSSQQTLHEIFYSDQMSDDQLANLVTQLDQPDADPWLPTPEQCQHISMQIGVNLNAGKGWSAA